MSAARLGLGLGLGLGATQASRGLCEGVSQYITASRVLYDNAVQGYYYNDKSGKGRRAILESNVSKFDGVDDYISGLEPMYTSTPNVQIEFDFKGTGTDQRVIYSESIGTGYFVLRYLSSLSRFGVKLVNSDGTVLLSKLSSTADLFVNTKNSIKWIDNNGVTELWFNGVKDGTNFNYNPTGDLTATNAVCGKFDTDTPIYFEGIIANLKQSRTDGTLLHWYKGDDADGTTWWDSVAGGVNAVANNIDVNTFWVKDNDFTSFQNEVGYSEGLGSQLIPAQVGNTGKVTGFDALGNPLTHKGRVKYPVKVVENAAYKFDGTAKLVFPDLTGITITSSEGTSTPTKSGNEILFTAGTIERLELSNGSIYKASEGCGATAYDSSGNGNHGTITNANLATFHSTDDDVRPDNLLDGFSQKLVCETAGTTSIPSTTAYGRWKSIIYHSTSGTNYFIAFITDLINWAVGNAYYIWIQNDGSLYLYKRDSGSAVLLILSSGGTILNDTYYEIEIVRNSYINEFVTGGVGAFAIYLLGGQYITRTKIGSTVVDNTFTTSIYTVYDLDAGDSIKNLQINEVYQQNLLAATDGTGTYSKVRVPARTSTLDVEGDELSNPAGAWHNNAESKILQYPSNFLNSTEAAIFAATGSYFWTFDGETPIKKSYNDFMVEDGNLADITIYDKDPLSSIITFAPDTKINNPDCWAKVAKKVGQ